jgi:hypothetical protein
MNLMAFVLLCCLIGLPHVPEWIFPRARRYQRHLKALFAAALQFDENSHQMRSRFSDNLNDTSAATEEAAEFRAEKRASN